MSVRLFENQWWDVLDSIHFHWTDFVSICVCKYTNRIECSNYHRSKNINNTWMVGYIDKCHSLIELRHRLRVKVSVLELFWYRRSCTTKISELKHCWSVYWDLYFTIILLRPNSVEPIQLTNICVRGKSVRSGVDGSSDRSVMMDPIIDVSF